MNTWCIYLCVLSGFSQSASVSQADERWVLRSRSHAWFWGPSIPPRRTPGITYAEQYPHHGFVDLRVVPVNDESPAWDLVVSHVKRPPVWEPEPFCTSMLAAAIEGIVEAHGLEIEHLNSVGIQFVTADNFVRTCRCFASVVSGMDLRLWAGRHGLDCANPVSWALGKRRPAYVPRLPDVSQADRAKLATANVEMHSFPQ